MNNFWQRTLSGAVYAGLVISSILVHPIFFGILFLFVTLLAVREYHHLLETSVGTTILAMLVGGTLFVIAWLIEHVDCIGLNTIGYLLAAFMLLVIVALIAELFLKANNPIANWGNLLSGVIMISLPFALMNGILAADKYYLLALFIIIWVNDTGAFCVGCLTAKRKNGNHKMFLRVSPKKSWEGLIGGFVFALVAGYICFVAGWFDTIWFALIFALIVAVAGTFGDLLESLMKRTIGVKDSGKFLPGHGGVLDRFDSILLAAPAVYILVVLF